MRYQSIQKNHSSKFFVFNLGVDIFLIFFLFIFFVCLFSLKFVSSLKFVYLFEVLFGRKGYKK